MSRIQIFLSPFLALTAALLLATACSVGGSDGASGFAVYRSDVSVAGGTPIAIAGKNVAFLADEATSGAGGTDLNQDGDIIDSIAVVIDMNSRVETTELDTLTPKGVAATALAWIGEHLYLVVDESLDVRDWNGDTDTADLVLLHWTASPADPPTFVDRLASVGAIKLVAVGTNLFYSSARVPTSPTESNLAVVTTTAPTTPVLVDTQDANGPLSPRILGKNEGLIFLSLDETAEARDLNGDTDTTDTSVLALLDGTLATTAVHGTELALPAAGSPFRARRTTATSHDWQVGFLVSETDQGSTNLNDPALFAGTWQPSQCTSDPDTDTTDSVLHFLQFAAWDADPVSNPPVNTGLVGTRRIAIANGYIATITPEQAAGDPNGAEGNCDLNGDADRNDFVVRWAQMASPVLPLTQVANLHALADVPGGTHGLAELGTRFAIEVSESDDDLDIDGDAFKTHDLIGWVTPTGSGNANTPWSWMHGCVTSGSSVNCNVPPPSFVGASWMAESADRSRLNVALEEEIEGVNINRHDPPIAGEDTDTLDSVPTFGYFTGSPLRISFPGVAIGVQNANAGIVVARNHGFYRVSEAEDSRDWNQDGLETGFVLFRTSLIQGVSNRMGPLNSLPGRNAIEVNPEESSPIGAVFLADEQLQGAAGTDLNGDLDTADLVISYFRF